MCGTEINCVSKHDTLDSNHRKVPCMVQGCTNDYTLVSLKVTATTLTHLTNASVNVSLPVMTDRSVSSTRTQAPATPTLKCSITMRELSSARSSSTEAVAEMRISSRPKPSAKTLARLHQWSVRRSQWSPIRKG